MTKRYLIMQLFRVFESGKPVTFRLTLPDRFVFYDRIFYTEESAAQAIKEFGKEGEHYVVILEYYIP